MGINQDALRLIGFLFKGKGASLPSTADFIGQLFVLNGASSGDGLYVATGTTTPGWKAVSHAE